MALAKPTSWSEKIFGAIILLIFLAYLSAHYFITLILEKLAVPEDREQLWRIMAHKKVRFLFKLARIKLHYPPDLLPPPGRPVIFVSNHPSELDGLIYFAVLGPNLIPLSEPYSLLPFPFNRWFPKMGITSVMRDDYDWVMATGGRDKKSAIRELIKKITKQKLNVLIFPEGHYERLNELHYFHTGAARVAISARVPITPLALVNEEHIHLGNLFGRAGHIYIRRHSPLRPPKTLTKVRQFSEQICEATISLLPQKNIPVDIYDPKPEKIGVFVDIDHTIYKGYSQQDFVKWLMREEWVGKGLALKVFYYLFLEKTRLISHEELMKRALGFLNGWQVEKIEKLAEQFFKEHAIAHLQSRMLPIMKDHQEREHQIILVTEVIEPLARQFQKYFQALDCGHTIVKKNRDGKYTGEVSCLCWREEKANQVNLLAQKYNLDLRKSYAYGDSPSDVDMLRCVKHKVAVCPKSELRHIALSEHWNIL